MGTMVELTFHSVIWGEDGRPVLALQIGEEQTFVTVQLTLDEVQALTVTIDAPESGYARLTSLLQSVLATLGARPVAIDVRVGADELLHAALVVRGRGGLFEIPVHTVDGLLIARRVGLPVRMVEDNARPAMNGFEQEGVREAARPVELAQRVADPLAPFRAVVETLAWPEVE